MVATVKGIDKKQAERFFQAMGTIASSKKRADVSQMSGFLQQATQAFLPKDYKPFGGTFDKSVNDRGVRGINFQTERQRQRFLGEKSNVLVNQDRESLVKAFRMRQDEVFGRRARPGVASQTRFM